MKYMPFLAMMAAASLVMTGCRPKSAAMVSPTVAPLPTAIPVPTSTTSSGNNGYSSDLYGKTYGNAATTPAAQAQPVSGTATLKVSQKDGIGSFLVDSNGMTVYLTTYDTANTSTCSGYCADNWPALAMADQPVAGDGVDASLLGTIQRDGGTTQITYNGHPLYTFRKDSAPGDINGQGVNGTWYVVSPGGDPVK